MRSLTALFFCATLAATVESARLAGADEILVVDDGSRDGTRALARQLAGVRLIERDRAGGPGVARNAVIESDAITVSGITFL